MFSINIMQIFILIQLIVHCSYAQRDKKFFRRDYKFLEDTQSFYKIHTLARTWQDARRTCKLEGGSLFYPENEEEANAVIKMWTDTQSVIDHIFIGISSLLAKGVFVTVDGVSISNVYRNWAKGEPNNASGNQDCVKLNKLGFLYDYNCNVQHSFICKKTLASLEWNYACNMPYTDYTYSKTLGRCYKFHLTPKNWTEAYATCNAEQSFLAIIQNQADADYLVKLTKEAPKDSVQGDYLKGAVILGFHNLNDEGWNTIRGTALERTGYSTWGYRQPDGGDKEKCGSMFYNGHLNDLGCHHKCFFICENDDIGVDLAFDERFESF
ncbi:macrophage mannose receptor 1-like [Achroia grisella]|uniref:macrophage mannose receptor 1-like n=1 Tax=Achroia grisella TaxID=688607 RepID=UPI0027D2D6AB|nr:macrophage mannose receptor 1-like [Achroia grisella]